METAVWDMQGTRTLMRGRLTSDHFESARRSIASAIDRREYARLHYHEIKDRWKKLLLVAATPSGVWDIVLGGTAEADAENENEAYLHAIGAHTVSCVQSLHAIPDIFAHGLYYSLGFATTEKLSERDISVGKVQRLLSKTPEHRQLAALLRMMSKAGEFQYLNALANHGKHRSIVKNALSADMTGADSELIRLNFEAFKYDGESYEQREVLPLLEAEFNRMSKTVVDAGIELHRLLKATADPS